MRTKKIVGLVAIAMLIIMFEPVFGLYIEDDHHLPDAPVSEAQMYFDTIPEESELKKCFYNTV